MRVGDQTDFNRVTLEIETDGTITPEAALWQATDLLLKQFEVVKSGVSEGIEMKKEEPEKKPKAKAKAKVTTKKSKK